MNRQELTRRIRDAARELGFDKVGVALPGDFSEEGGRLREWIDRGYHAGMEWMVTHFNKRVDPSSLMENTRSIVCVGMNYYHEDPPNPHADGVKISKYARGTDYHDVLKKRLRQLLRQIREWAPEAQGRALTDSAPIMERPLAVRAGLGWIGKNGMLITPDRGSYLFLGELLLNIELEPDTAEVPNHCGTCTRCIDACPTDAIVEPSVIDSNRCISYWTIEYKGESLPEEIAGNLDGWAFGCDICQQVCPWNIRFSQETGIEEFLPRPWNAAPRASEIETLDEAAFAERYRKSPVKRTKLSGFRRNARAAARSEGPHR